MNKFEFMSKYEDYEVLDEQDKKEPIMLVVVPSSTIRVYEFLIVPGDKDDRRLIQQFFLDAVESGFKPTLIAQVSAGFVPARNEHATAVSYIVEFV